MNPEQNCVDGYDYSVVCGVFVPTEHNSDNNPEFYQIWDEIGQTYAKCHDLVAVKCKRVLFTKGMHSLNNSIWISIYNRFGKVIRYSPYDVLLLGDYENTVDLMDDVKQSIERHVDSVGIIALSRTL